MVKRNIRKYKVETSNNHKITTYFKKPLGQKKNIHLSEILICPKPPTRSQFLQKLNLPLILSKFSNYSKLQLIFKNSLKNLQYSRILGIVQEQFFRSTQGLSWLKIYEPNQPFHLINNKNAKDIQAWLKYFFQKGSDGQKGQNSSLSSDNYISSCIKEYNWNGNNVLVIFGDSEIGKFTNIKCVTNKQSIKVQCIKYGDKVIQKLNKLKTWLNYQNITNSSNKIENILNKYTQEEINLELTVKNSRKKLTIIKNIDLFFQYENQVISKLNELIFECKIKKKNKRHSRKNYPILITSSILYCNQFQDNRMKNVMKQNKLQFDQIGIDQVSKQALSIMFFFVIYHQIYLRKIYDQIVQQTIAHGQGQIQMAVHLNHKISNIQIFPLFQFDVLKNFVAITSITQCFQTLQFYSKELQNHQIEKLIAQNLCQRMLSAYLYPIHNKQLYNISIKQYIEMDQFELNKNYSILVGPQYEDTVQIVSRNMEMEQNQDILNKVLYKWINSIKQEQDKNQNIYNSFSLYNLLTNKYKRYKCDIIQTSQYNLVPIESNQKYVLSQLKNYLEKIRLAPQFITRKDQFMQIIQILRIIMIEKKNSNNYCTRKKIQQNKVQMKNIEYFFKKIKT